MTTNPYQPPQTFYSTASDPRLPVGLFRDFDGLVVHRDAAIPMVCMGTYTQGDEFSLTALYQDVIRVNRQWYGGRRFRRRFGQFSFAAAHLMAILCGVCAGVFEDVPALGLPTLIGAIISSLIGWGMLVWGLRGSEVPTVAWRKGPYVSVRHVNPEYVRHLPPWNPMIVERL